LPLSGAKWQGAFQWLQQACQPVGLKGGWRDCCIVNVPERSGSGGFRGSAGVGGAAQAAPKWVVRINCPSRLRWRWREAKVGRQVWTFLGQTTQIDDASHPRAARRGVPETWSSVTHGTDLVVLCAKMAHFVGMMSGVISIDKINEINGLLAFCGVWHGRC
jgi:hypothetical protein